MNDISPSAGQTGASIVVGTDGSERAQVAVDRAGELASALGVTVHLVCSYGSSLSTLQEAVGGVGRPGLAGTRAARDARGEAESVVEHARDRLAARGIDVIIHLSGDEAAHALIAVADEERAQMIVVGNRGMIGARRALGSVPNRVSHQAHCAVLIVPT